MIGSTEMERDMTDFLLIPDLKGLTVADFNKIDEFVARGEEAAARQEAEDAADEESR